MYICDIFLCLRVIGAAAAAAAAAAGFHVFARKNSRTYNM